MLVIGQDNIVKRVWTIIHHIEEGDNFCLLFIGSAGMGKTFICKNIAYILDSEWRNTWYYTVEKEINIYRDRRFIILDEIHKLENFESLYDRIDSKEQTFLCASNLYGKLPESFLSRCIVFIFEPYTKEDIIEIIKNNSYYDNEISELIAEYSIPIPREVKNILRELKLYHPNNIHEVESILTNVLELEKGGLNKLDRLYIECLKKLSPVSLQVIAGVTKLQKEIIVNIIEPKLITLGMMQITRRGRKYVA